MKRKRFTEERIIGILREADAGAVVLDLCRKHGMSSATYYTWKAKYGGLEVSQAKRLRSLEDENGKLKRLLAHAMLDSADLKDLLAKNGDARCEARSGRASAGSPEGERAAGVQHCRRGSPERPLPKPTRRRHRSARTASRPGAGATTVRLSLSAHLGSRRDGIVINRKKTQRLYTEEGLTVHKRKSRRRAVGARGPLPVMALPNERWSLDFVHDQLVGGRQFRVLSVVDDVTRECLAAVADTSISQARSTRARRARRAAWQADDDRLRQWHRADVKRGPVVGGRCRHRVALHRSGQADARHGFVESFNGRMRDELLNETLFMSIGHAREAVAA